MRRRLDGKTLTAVRSVNSAMAEDVPDVVGDDVADDEVNVASGVDAAGEVAAGLEGVSVDGTCVGGLDLHAPAASVDFDDEVVAVALAPGFGDAESEGGGFVEEGGFGDFSATLGGELGLWSFRVKVPARSLPPFGRSLRAGSCRARCGRDKVFTEMYGPPGGSVPEVDADDLKAVWRVSAEIQKDHLGEHVAIDRNSLRQFCKPGANMKAVCYRSRSTYLNVLQLFVTIEVGYVRLAS